MILRTFYRLPKGIYDILVVLRGINAICQRHALCYEPFQGRTRLPF
jgi:hypothetical protein